MSDSVEKYLSKSNPDVSQHSEVGKSDMVAEVVPVK